MDSELKYIHVAWISAIHAGMTGFNTLVYNDERRSVGTMLTGTAIQLVSLNQITI
ncbi:MAG TPA: hypothetical protein VIJ25_03895 [Methylococcales bacterium]